ncbi:MAG: restriction endonuclease subunit S, partial [Oscillospiraceae bacterium]|nr:restriction endonuclease subunit S [Oscillospiraceae bacterium]
MMVNVPEIRFKGFTDAWEQRTFAGVAKVNSGRDYKHLNHGCIPVYGTGGYMLSVDESLSDEDAVGLGRKGTIDKPQLLNAPFWTVDTLFFLTPKPNNDLRFLFALTQNIEWAKLDESTGVPSLSKVNIESVMKYLPDYPEQSLIGTFFRTLDNTIAIYKRKLNGLREFKKTYLQQMFPQAGETVPRVRFEGFVEPWEMRKLGDIVNVNSG